MRSRLWKHARPEIAKIEKESLDATGLRSEVVPLYQGGEYWLYRYKEYTDVRLVFAPEQQIAFYGGDPDNFTYPRFDLDMAIFRVYENGKPIESQHYLKWNRQGAPEGDLVFVSGHPGSTDRLDTMAQIETQRDYSYPQTLKTLKHRVEVLRRYSSQGPEQARQAQGLIFSLENAIKAYNGEYQGLLDKNLIAKKEKEEREFRALVEGASLKFLLFSNAPVYPQMEERLLADGLQESLEVLGPNDPFIKAALNDRTPADTAHELITGTKLGDPALRKSLVEGGETAVASSNDPLIVFVRKIDPMIREMRKSFEDNVHSVETDAGEKIGKARFAVYGKAIYPDATFTLRLAYGTVKSYPMNGTIAPPVTTFYGLFDRYYSFNRRPPFDLPARYLERRERLDLSTPLNFVSDCDIIGGNSGSPVINREGELVGLIFDGNIESLVGRFVYDGTANRAVAVHSGALIEALRKLYDAGALAEELEGKMTKNAKVG